MGNEDMRRMQYNHGGRGASASQPQSRGAQDPNSRARYSGAGQARASYMINTNNVYARYRPSRPSSYRQKNLTRNDIIKALSQGQERIPFHYKDYKAKWDKLHSKEGLGIRSYLDIPLKTIKDKDVEPARVKTHRDYMLDEVEYMNIDFREEKKLKKSLATKFIHEISDVAGNRTEKKEKKEL